jgi:hypothetical protein
MSYPDIVFVGGKKRAGKDFFCDALASELGYYKCHIVAPWLAGFQERHGLTPEEYEADKGRWRPVVQAEATEARRKDPDCLVRAFRAALPTLPRPLAVTAVRFRNEADLGHELGALVLRVRCRDEVRRQRFLDSGEGLALFDDPFEAEVDSMPVHYEVSGTLSADTYSWLLPKLWRCVLAERKALTEASA